MFAQAERMKNAPLSKIREIIEYAGALERSGKKIIHMEIGEPDFDTPAHITAAAQRALTNNEVHYGPIMGIMPLRKAVAAWLTRRYHALYSADEVLVTTGVAQGIFLTMMAYLNPDDEILVPDPGYLAYFAVPNIAEAKAVPYALRESEGYQISREGLERHITPKTKAILLNSPSNPCGSILNRASLEAVADCAAAHDLLIISDEVYSEMVYGDAEFVSMSAVERVRERTIILNGFSKYYAMTGWRLGYLACAAPLMNPLMRLNFYNLSCPNTFVQSAAVTALESDDAPSRTMVKEYCRRRDVLTELLNTLPGCSCGKPDGAFYVFLNVKGTSLTADEFCKYMLDEAGVALTPGPVFGAEGHGYVRVSYAASMESIKHAVTLMREALMRLSAS